MCVREIDREGKGMCKSMMEETTKGPVRKKQEKRSIAGSYLDH